MADLQVSTEQRSDDVIVRAAGEIDLHTCEMLKQRIWNALELQPASLTIDLCEVTFMDSTGLGLMIETKIQAEQIACKLTVRVDTEAVRRLFELTRLDGYLSVVSGNGDGRAPSRLHPSALSGQLRQ